MRRVYINQKGYLLGIIMKQSKVFAYTIQHLDLEVIDMILSKGISYI